MTPRTLLFLALMSAAARAAPELSLTDAIRTSWASHPGLRAGEETALARSAPTNR